MPKTVSTHEDKNILVLDGSIGDQLKRFPRVMDLGSSVPYKDAFSNSSYANIRDPDIVLEVHKSYVLANCDVITTNSFGCTLHALTKAHIEGHRDEMVLKSCIIAKNAAHAANGRIPWVAGSVGPLGECYMNDCPTETEMEGEYEALIRLLCSGGVDIILCETMSSIKEALCAATQARMLAPQKMLWVSFTLDDTLDKSGTGCRLRSRESLETAIYSIVNKLGAQEIWAILVNCCHVKIADAAVKVLRKSLQGTHIRYGVYANGFKRTTTEWIMAEYGTIHNDEYRHIVSEPNTYGDDIFSAQEYADHARQWVQDGATIVGGCCGVGPEHIRVLSDLVKGT